MNFKKNPAESQNKECRRRKKYLSHYTKFLTTCETGDKNQCIQFLIDFFNSSLKRPKDYETELGLAVLATIPRLYQPRDKMLERINLGLTVASLVVAAALTTGFAVLIVKGVEPTLEAVRLYAGI